MSCLTRERLLELVDYNPTTGVFTTRVPRGNLTVGDVMGWDSGKGYQRVLIDGERHMLHNLAFLYMTGNYPKELVDHKDTNTNNNKWDNLREASTYQNALNKSLRKDNTTGSKGVSLTSSGSFMVRVGQKSYGCFRDLEEASLVAVAVRNKLHGEFANHG